MPSSAAREGEPAQPSDLQTVFGVTVEDIAALSEEDFDEVWSALGKVARARANSKRQEKESPQSDRTGEEGGNQ
jgi:hypothetical protein